MTSKYKINQWYPWSVGSDSPPVHKDTEVTVMMATGVTMSTTASTLLWTTSGSNCDIVAFKVDKEVPKEPRTFWIDTSDNEVFRNFDQMIDRCGKAYYELHEGRIIQVKEVLSND